MWNNFPTLPKDVDGTGSKKEVVVYWPAYFPNGSRVTVHTFDSVPELLKLDEPPTMWASLDPVAEDTMPPTADAKAAVLGKLIAQIDAQGGDSSVLVAIAADAKIALANSVVPDPAVQPAPLEQAKL